MGRKRRTRLTRALIAERLQRSYFLRLHMSLILGGTFLAGLAATKLLLVIGVDTLAWRYVLAVVAAYLVFLLLIRLWLFYVGADRHVEIGADGADILLENIGGPDVDTPAIGGGGQFGGGGATGAWGPPAPAQSAAPVSGGSSWMPDLDLDFDGLVVVILFLALVGSLLIVGIYIIYTAPVLLSEAAFEALLAGALARRARKIDRPGWVGKVWRSTIWIFVLTVVLAGALGWAVQRKCPAATRLSEAFDCPSPPRVH